MADLLKKFLERTKHRVDTAPRDAAPIVRSRVDEDYDMTLEFLTGRERIEEVRFKDEDEEREDTDLSPSDARREQGAKLLDQAADILEVDDPQLAQAVLGLAREIRKAAELDRNPPISQATRRLRGM